MIKAIIILTAICLLFLIIAFFLGSLLIKSSKEKKELKNRLQQVKTLTKELSDIDLKVKNDEKKLNQGSINVQFNTAIEQLQNLTH
jgi:methyl-accepting chemotaxis protein